MTFRASIKAIVPRWLLGPVGEKLLHAITLPVDALAYALDYGNRGRMPGNGVESALRLVGEDRRMLRYPLETDAEYATRLSMSFDLWKTAGLARAIIREVEGFCGPSNVRVRVVARSGLWHSLAEGQGPDGTIVKFNASPENWFWDSLDERYWRFWVIIYPNGLWTSTRKWDGAMTWGEDQWGLSIPGEQASALRELVRRWKPAKCQCVWLIYALDNDLFDPSATYPDASLPDPTWENWTKLDGGMKVPSRSPDARYQAGLI